MSFNCELELSFSGGFVYAMDTTIARFHVGTFTQFIGIVPVVEVVYLDFIAGFEAEVAGENTIVTGFEFASSIEVGARYQDSRWSTVYEHENVLNRGPIRWNTAMQTSIKGFVKPRISIELYRVVGPYIETKPYLRL